MKAHFLLDPEVVFLNHGSFGACPRAVLEACQGWQREIERNPVQFLGRRSGALLAGARAALAAYLGARAEDLVFVPNATHGVNTVARSLPLAEGDEVLGTDHEYGACARAWEFACARAGARYRRVRVPLPFDPGAFTEAVWAGVTARTRVLFLSHITSTTALVWPVRDLLARARAAGILTVVDGAHAPGQIPLDLDALGADFYTGNCHKWLCAPKGTAFLHARAGRHALLDAPAVSWGYVAERDGVDGYDPFTGATLLERRLQWQGTRDLAAFLAVPAALDFQARHDWDAVRARCHGLVLEARRRMAALTGLEPPCPDAQVAQMAILPVPGGEPEALQRLLFERHRIEIPVTVHEGRPFLRISIQAYNGPEDLDALLAAYRKLMSAADEVMM